jgi:hypothetical protein
MMKFFMTAMLIAIVALSSCIFQNSPVEPNQAPTIRSYSPTLTFFSLKIPDSCVFSIKASDPDGDQLEYSFVTGDSTLSETNSLKFYAMKLGVYDIRGRVKDGATTAYHDWRVTVLDKDNQTPKITWVFPEQSLVACAVGETLGFHFKATDDHPDALQYSYLLDGALLQSGSPDIINRFMEQGDFLLEGVAWDGQAGDTTRWNVSVMGYPDSIPPAAILDLAGGPGAVDGSIALKWTAPGDDGNEGKAASYIVKTSVYTIVTEKDWVEAEGKVGEPVPSPAGSPEQMTIRNLSSASYVYVSMRAMDDFFNLSPIGNCIKILVRGVDIGGRITNAATGGPVPGIIVSASLRSDTTDAEGTYLLQNVPSYTTSMSAKDEKIVGELGDYFDCSFTITNVTQYTDKSFCMIPAFVLESVAMPDIFYEGRFLMFFKAITETDGSFGDPTVYKGWNHWPITVYNPSMTCQDADLQAACRNGMRDWEDSTGIDLFVEVGSLEDADVSVQYDTTKTDYKHHVKTPEANADGTPARKEIWIYTKNTSMPVWKLADLIFAHELGHVIGLYHSWNPGHLMLGLTTPEVKHPTLDEARVVQVLYHMPSIFDSANIKEE